ncbi:hypothetical protein F4861DRAFT_538691 [Xylaria intraflava]|nr:hypothetical protein F4861DRAFT_538691 [Xylaria intraflava]
MASIDSRFPQQADLEVVPAETGLYYPPPAHASPPAATPGPWPKGPALKEQANAQTPAQVEGQTSPSSRRTILGLSVTVFWSLVVVLVIVLAAAIGGGVGGGLSAQGKSVSKSDAASGDISNPNGGISTPVSPVPSPTSSPAADPLVPTDAGCPGINNIGYTPYAADGKPVPMQAGGPPQEFREQCWTNWANTATTHDILRTYTPTLENCIVVCAEYNRAYMANLQNNIDVGGGPCVAVTIVKEHAGFCYLKNGTGTNDTMGSPMSYSSAVLLTGDSS